VDFGRGGPGTPPPTGRTRIYPCLSWGGRILPAGGNGISLVAALATLPELLFPPSHCTFRVANPGRSSAPLFERRLHPGYRMVSFAWTGSGRNLDGQAGLRRLAQMAGPSRYSTYDRAGPLVACQYRHSLAA